MSITIKPITPDTATTFTDYFQSVSFDHAPDWSTCYCQFYHQNCDIDTWSKRTGDQNKADAEKAIKSNQMKGFLAFENEQCIGWLNSNDLSQYPRLSEYASQFPTNQKIATTICFVIHPNHRGKGVARKLLEFAIRSYQESGYDQMVAFPYGGSKKERRYRGTLNMYLENGYKILETHENLTLLTLNLKSGR